jgi:hypothetical protein
MTVATLKAQLEKFKKMHQDQQRTILGELLYPLIAKIVKQPDSAPKITGMLIDFSVFDVDDIVEFLENVNSLEEKVREAEDLMVSLNN